MCTQYFRATAQYLLRSRRRGFAILCVFLANVFMVLSLASDLYECLTYRPHWEEITSDITQDYEVKLPTSNSTTSCVHRLASSLVGYHPVGPVSSASVNPLPLDMHSSWRPQDCEPLDNITIIVPFRDRTQHLSVLLGYLHPMLRRQHLDYSIVVVEQAGKGQFNKGRLMNIGFVESQRIRRSTCVIFHDVDQIPTNDYNLYTCTKWPRHHCVVNSAHGRLMYPSLVGGALNFPVEQFKKVNGYSNIYWGWGAEDDDMALRIHYSGLRITRPSAQVGTYTALSHADRHVNPVRHELMKNVHERQTYDGINSLNYTVLQTQFKPFYVYMLVDVGPGANSADTLMCSKISVSVLLMLNLGVFYS